jgi:hypothetical protein
MSCRYYGKHQVRGGQLVDQGGNQCGAITYSYTPCLFEIEGAPPDETACSIALQEIAQPSPHGGAGVVTISSKT